MINPRVESHVTGLIDGMVFMTGDKKTLDCGGEIREIGRSLP